MGLETLPFSQRGQRLIGQEMFKVLERAKAIERGGQHVYHLELGNSCFPPPPEVTKATMTALANEEVGYAPSAGHIELRAALAEHYRQHGCAWITEEGVVVSPANLLINQVLDLVANEHDRIVVFTPGFPTYLAASEHIGLTPKLVSLECETGFQLTERAIDEAMAFEPTVIIINSANNPTGAVYTQSSLEYLAHQCDQRGIWVLSDETYAELCYRSPYWSLSACEYERIIVVSSFSKAYSIPGYRTGYALAHPAVARKLTLSCSTLFSCLPSFTQEGCLAAIREGETYLRDVRAYYSHMVEHCADMIDQSQVLHCSVPESAFYLFVDIRETRLRDQEFCERLLRDHHTALTPGRSFGRGFDAYVRVSVSGPQTEVLEGVRRLVTFGREVAYNRSWSSAEINGFRKVGHAV